MPFAVKAEIADPRATSFMFTAQKTMYGGKYIAAGDTVYVFASEHEGGKGLIARGTAVSAALLPRLPGIARQTPRVSVVIRRSAAVLRPLGRRQLVSFSDWEDGRPETELNFKLYRQATNKIVGLTDGAATFLDGYF
ncbi:hypothetical protein [Chelatococcus asaccharovorans]|uniref:Uncharacterized protein n=1 Tax=Chelatococcus asaccharovorans TaxID=28210 RepID=A0A2V3TWQ4_9HYPH|nr:hypothetical protein [Chelatococcus asaccharovorans]MBS7705105.1 hypothetical protein [Chelatococcus asaccharovorans]PXW53597.1 hypothetical protein C7450_11385 [Chelatococcus asaccharovorans]CAH1652530.1 conserved hypothetical protein [Chelatococcus asaccharovorans]CAH1686311.1 conserved hypothetical protein [Chelatococcus asaccharovorans]